MLHKKSPLTISDNETLSNKSNLTRNTLEIKCIGRRLPPNGQFYMDVLRGISIFPDEPVVLIYVGHEKPWGHAKVAKEIGLPPPIVLDIYTNPKAFIWPASGLKVRVIEWCITHEKFQTELATELSIAGATEVQYSPFIGHEGLATLQKIVPNHELNHKVVRYE